MRMSKKWGWKIIKDNTFNPEFDDKPLVGKTYHEYQGGQHRWRLKDDDGEIYYYFLSDIDPNEGTEDEVFAPLDWARNYAGCTTLEYKDKDGEYKVI